MTKQKSPDKNLQNEVKNLAIEGVNTHQAQQLKQDINDRKHKDALNHQ